MSEASIESVASRPKLECNQCYAGLRKAKKGEASDERIFEMLNRCYDNNLDDSEEVAEYMAKTSGVDVPEVERHQTP